MGRFKYWCPISIPLLFLVLALPVFSQGSGTSDTEFTNSTSRPIRHTAPLVVDGEGGFIGYYLGTSTTHSMNGLPIKGFEILTAAGYTSVIQANGAIGFIGAVLFSKDACQGNKYYPYCKK